MQLAAISVEKEIEGARISGHKANFLVNNYIIASLQLIFVYYQVKDKFWPDKKSVWPDKNIFHS